MQKQHTAEYPGDEGDIIEALQVAPGGLSFEQLVAVVHGTEDTLFAFDKKVTEELFDIIDHALGDER